KRKAELIVGLGKVLATDGWQSRVDAVQPGDDAKTYALGVLRKAMEGDTDGVTAMLTGIVASNLLFAVEADTWLREGLRYEVLGIRPPPEAPLGWEGPYFEPVDSVGDFVQWLDLEILVIEVFNRGQQNQPSHGNTVRDAFRLVMKLELS